MRSVVEDCFVVVCVRLYAHVNGLVIVCVCVCFSCGGPDAVSSGPDEETRLHGRSAELHLSSEPSTSAGKPEVGHQVLCVCVDNVHAVRLETWII